MIDSEKIAKIKAKAEAGDVAGSDVLWLIARLGDSPRASGVDVEGRFKEHTQHVQQFLNDLWAFSIDPLHEGMEGLKIADVCAALLKAAKDNRDREYELTGLFRTACLWVWKGLDAPGQTLESTAEAMRAEYAKESRKHIAQPVAPRPKIICLCGSTRFIEQFAIQTWELELQGHIVLGCTLLPKWYCPVRDHFAETLGVNQTREGNWTK